MYKTYIHVLYICIYISTVVVVYAKALTTERQISLWYSNNVNVCIYTVSECTTEIENPV